MCLLLVLGFGAAMPIDTNRENARKQEKIRRFIKKILN